MNVVRKNHGEAEHLYHRAWDLDPDHTNNIGNFALFPHEVRKDYDEAERLYRRALELDLGHAHHMGNFAEFMEKVRKNYDEAERLIARRWNLIPKKRSSEKLRNCKKAAGHSLTLFLQSPEDL